MKTEPPRSSCTSQRRPPSVGSVSSRISKGIFSRGLSRVRHSPMKDMVSRIRFRPCAGWYDRAMADPRAGDRGAPLARAGAVLADLCERWFPDAFVFALAAVAVVFAAGLAVGERPLRLVEEF